MIKFNLLYEAAGKQLKEAQIKEITCIRIIKDVNDKYFLEAKTIDNQTIVVMVNANENIKRIIKEKFGVKIGEKSCVFTSKQVWSKWEDRTRVYIDPFNGERIRFCYQIRNDGKRVQVRHGALKARSSCNFAAGDEFNLNIGEEIALNRLIVKIIQSKMESKNKM